MPTKPASETPSRSPHSSSRSSPPSLHAAGDPGGILDFVQNLDSALGNPSNAVDVVSSKASVSGGGDVIDQSFLSSGAVDMKISNTVVLLGGALASLSFAGLAFVFSRQDGEEQVDDSTQPDATPAPTKLNEDALRKLEAGVISASPSPSPSWTDTSREDEAEAELIAAKQKLAQAEEEQRQQEEAMKKNDDGDRTDEQRDDKHHKRYTRRQEQRDIFQRAGP